MAAAEDAASDRAMKQQEEALRIKLKSKKRPQEELSSDEDDSSTYEPSQATKEAEVFGKGVGIWSLQGGSGTKKLGDFPEFNVAGWHDCAAGK